MITVRLPRGLRPGSLPPPTRIDSFLGTFELSATALPDGALRFRSALRPRIERVEPERYDEMRRLVEQVRDARNARVRLVTP